MLENKIVRQLIECGLAVAFGAVAYQVMVNSYSSYLNQLAVPMAWAGFFLVLYGCAWTESRWKYSLLKIGKVEK